MVQEAYESDGLFDSRAETFIVTMVEEARPLAGRIYTNEIFDISELDAVYNHRYGDLHFLNMTPQHLARLII